MKQILFKIVSFFMLISTMAAPCAFALGNNIEGIQIYQKNLRLSEARKQGLAYDIDRYRHTDNIWDVLRSGFALSHEEDNPDVQAQLDFFMNNQDFLLHSAQRAAPYLYYISQQVHQRHLPAEIVLLPMIESAYNPFAYSTAGAGGIWQMMPATATGFGIKQNWWYDGRRDVIASTKAALNYLVYLGGFFDGNWLLALAAYNTGEGNVLAAIRKNIRDGKPTDFWSLPLSQQTREYVPRLLALATIIAHPNRYPVPFPAVRNSPYLAQVDVGKPIDLSHAAYLAGLSLARIKQLNPGYNHMRTDPNGPYKLILPIQNVAQFTENRMRLPLIESPPTPMHIPIRYANPVSSSPARNKFSPIESQINALLAVKKLHYSLKPNDTLYIVRRGDTLPKIANQFHIPLKVLLAVNQLKMLARVPPGAKLMIPTHLNKPTKIRQYQLAPGDTLYLVRRGDTVEKIAKKFHMSAPTLRLANLLTSNVVEEGDRLVIPNLTRATTAT